MTSRDIISIVDLTREDILHLCSFGAQLYAEDRSGQRLARIDSLKGKVLASLFYEPSTRTRSSFETGFRELGGFDPIGFSGTEGTSVAKGETIRDTIMMMQANHADVIVMRHPVDGSLQWAADVASIPVISGGDGRNEHPTQALLDLLTLYQFNNKKLDGLRIGLGGDLKNGRTIRSLTLALSHFHDVQITWAAEDPLGMPHDLEQNLRQRDVHVERKTSVAEVLESCEFYYMTRPQLERMKDVSQREIHALLKRYRIDAEAIAGFTGRLLHPLPIDSRLSEITADVAFSPVQGFYAQAEFGVFMRKALLYEILHDVPHALFSGELPHELQSGNNRIYRAPSGKLVGEKFVGLIESGICLDHLRLGTAQQIADALELVNRGAGVIAATWGAKSFLKTSLDALTERDLKTIALISPEPTINIVRDRAVQDKYVYLLCENDTCITRVITEDVPPKFYYDGNLRCRYCRRPYEIRNQKVLEDERQRFLNELAKSVHNL